ncbi:MAG: hypothetical protein RQ758_00695 [Methanomicrobiaceae archaeon]|nr:hypothetical protein [Methanomicrobiaceae archaeon]
MKVMKYSSAGNFAPRNDDPPEDERGLCHAPPRMKNVMIRHQLVVDQRLLQEQSRRIR